MNWRHAVKVTTVHQIQALLRGRRTALNRTQGVVARDAGVSRKWVSDFERGVSISVELPQLLRVVAALDLSLDLTPVVAGAASTSQAVSQDVDLDGLLERHKQALRIYT